MFLSLFTTKNNFAIFENESQNNIEVDIKYKKSSKTDIVKILSDKNFKNLPNSNSFGATNGQYWIKLTFKKAINLSELIAYIPTHNIDKIDIYRAHESKFNFITSVGNSIKRQNLQLDYQFPTFKVNLNKDKKTVYYLKVLFLREANFPIKVFSEKGFLNHILKKNTINSLYYGTCLIIIVLNFFFFIKLRDKVYLFYALFLSSLMTLFLLYDGSLIHLFRGNSFYYNLEIIIHFSGLIWFLLFSIKFLNLHKTNPKSTKIFFFFPVFVAIFYFLFLCTNNFFYVAIGETIGVSLFPILWFYAIHYMNKIPSIRFYVIGYFLVVPLAVFFIAGYKLGYWKVAGDMIIVKIASWLDILVFTYAISNRVKIKIANNDKDILELKELIEEVKLLQPETANKTNPYLFFLNENEISLKPLTLREVEILECLNKGYNNKQISENLFISPNTVKSHIRNIYSKLNVKSRVDLQEKIKIISI